MFELLCNSKQNLTPSVTSNARSICFHPKTLSEERLAWWRCARLFATPYLPILLLRTSNTHRYLPIRPKRSAVVRGRRAMAKTMAPMGSAWAGQVALQVGKPLVGSVETPNDPIVFQIEVLHGIKTSIYIDCLGMLGLS